VSLEIRTDIPETRLASGEVLYADSLPGGSLTVASSRVQSQRWYASFEGVEDRTAAEALRGTILTIEAESSEEENAWYAHELVGLRVQHRDGTHLGTVTGLEHRPAQDMLVVKETSGAHVRIPFVEQLVPEVNDADGVVVVDPPGGLFSSSDSPGVKAE